MSGIVQVKKMQETCGEEIMALDKNSAIAVVVDFPKKAVQ